MALTKQQLIASGYTPGMAQGYLDFTNYVSSWTNKFIGGTADAWKKGWEGQGISGEGLEKIINDANLPEEVKKDVDATVNKVKDSVKESTGSTGDLGFPKSSKEYDQWIKQGRTFSDGKWNEAGSSSGSSTMSLDEIGKQLTEIKKKALSIQSEIGGATDGNGEEVDNVVEDTVIEEDVLDNKWAKMLEGDTAEIYVQYKNMLKDGTVEEQKAWVDALDQAGKDSDAYFAEKLNIFKDEFRDALGTLNADLEAREAELSLRSQRLKDNLENQKGDLSVEQNAELARKQIDYTNVLKDTRSSMASRGLSSSSIRNQAEEKLNVAQEDIIESTNRRYSRATRDAALVESRGLEDITAAQTELARKAEEAKTSGVKEAEQTWGTGRLEGLGSLGGLDFSKYTSGLVSQGTAKEAQASDIKSRVNTTLTAQFY